MFVKIENLISLFQNLPQILYNVIPIRRVFTRRTQFFLQYSWENLQNPREKM